MHAHNRRKIQLISQNKFGLDISILYQFDGIWPIPVFIFFQCLQIATSISFWIIICVFFLSFFSGNTLCRTFVFITMRARFWSTSYAKWKLNWNLTVCSMGSQCFRCWMLWIQCSVFSTINLLVEMKTYNETKETKPTKTTRKTIFKWSSSRVQHSIIG